MKKALISLFLTTIILGVHAQEGVLRHVVSFKFKSELTEVQTDSLIEAFANLKNEIKEVKAFEWGTNNSPENLDKGLTHCFVLTFSNEADRDAYLPHPAHKSFVEKYGPYVEDVFVIDYYAKEE